LRKLLFALLILNTLFLGVISLFNFSLILPESMETNKAAIIIQKPVEETMAEFAGHLDEISRNLSTDLLYRDTRVIGSKAEYIFYKTNNDPDFLSLPVDGDSTLLAEGEYFTTKVTGGKGERRILLLSLDAEYTIRGMEEIASLTFDKAAFYIDPAKSDALLSSIKSEGYSVEKIEYGMVFMSQTYILYLGQGVLMAFLLLSSLFYTFSLGKEIVIKRLSGYTKKQLLKDVLISNLLPFTGICLLTLFVFSIACEIMAIGSLFTFFLFSYKWYFYLFFAVFFMLSISTVYLVTREGNETLKGKSNLPELYAITIIAKFIVFAIGIICLTYAVSGFSKIYAVQKSYNEIAQKTEGYVTLPCYDKAGLAGLYEEDYSARFDKLYKITVEPFDGIVISTDQYQYLGGAAPSLGDQFIEVNENYLNTTPIMDLHGNRITGEDLPNNEFVVLIPESRSMDEEIIRSKFKYCIVDKNTNFYIVYYASNTHISSYDSGTFQYNYGTIIDPVIRVYNDTYPTFYATNYITGQSYLLKTKTNNPYAEILPYLKEAKLENTIISCKSVKDNYADDIERSQTRLTIFIMGASIAMMILFVLIVYESSVYFASQSKKIAVKRLHGYHFWQIYKFPLIVRCLSLCLIVPVSWVMFKNAAPSIAFSLLDFAAFYFYAKRFERKNIGSIIKGDAK